LAKFSVLQLYAPISLIESYIELHFFLVVTLKHLIFAQNSAMKTLTLLLTTLFISGLNAQQTNSFSSEIPHTYFSFVLKLTKETPGFTPPVASRAFGYTGLALYESVVEGIPSKVSMVNKIAQFQSITSADPTVQYHWPTVANNALAGIIDSLWANASQSNKDSLLAIKDAYNTIFQTQVSATIYADSKTYGESIASDIFQYSKSDGAHEAFNSNFPSSYTPPVANGFWVPLAGQAALQPYWGYTRPFVYPNIANVIPGPPPTFSTDVNSVFYGYANDVYTQSLNNTPEQITIASYWADGGGTITPPGHSIAMLRNILIHENANLETSAIQYAKMGMAVADAFRACWKTKYLYNCTRPVTYIKDNIDASWNPLLSTPPFPEYSSGHSSQSGAMSEIMEAYLGTSYAFVDSAHGTNFGGPRSFTSFDHAAEEAAISRLYGGIHFEFGNEVGLLTGRKVGANINILFDNLTSSLNENENVQVELFPNPAENEIQLRMDGLENYTIEIFNLMGQKMELASANSGKLDVSHLASGMYQILISDAQASTKILKNFVKR
jgi:Secretion system C-terminal sorting domain/PAP2 superfamily